MRNHHLTVHHKIHQEIQITMHPRPLIKLNAFENPYTLSTPMPARTQTIRSMAGSSEPPRSGSNGAGAGGGAPCDCLRSGPPRQSLLPILQRTVPTLVSAAERCALAVAEHPLIKPLLSFQSESRRFFQVSPNSSLKLSSRVIFRK